MTRATTLNIFIQPGLPTTSHILKPVSNFQICLVHNPFMAGRYLPETVFSHGQFMSLYQGFVSIAMPKLTLLTNLTGKTGE